MTSGPSEHDRRVLRAGEVTISCEPVPVPVRAQPGPAAGRAAPPAGEPEVRLERGPDGSILAIEVRCPCGRVTKLRCEYPQ